MLLTAKKINKMPREEDLIFDAYIDDAVLWGQKLLFSDTFCFSIKGTFMMQIECHKTSVETDLFRAN